MLVTLAFLAMAAPDTTTVKIYDILPTTGKNDFTVANRAPLQPAPLFKLPIGAIKPKGWVLKQLQLEAEGFTGRLTEISPFLAKSNNAWLAADGKGEHGWEEVPYWLKGFGDLGYILDDPRIKAEAKVWIEGTLGSKRQDGYFGPEANRTANGDAPDVWPNMVMLNCLQSAYEYQQDPRILSLMSDYFRWQLALPDNKLLLSYWEKHRGGDNIGTIYWLYNRTGEKWLLDLVKKIHRRSADWVGGLPDFHGVNFAQAFREPAQVSILTKDKAQFNATEKDYRKMRSMYGQVPGGLYGADENARPGYSDPRQAAETCAMTEMMFSTEMLLLQTGNKVWAERCEDVAFNSLPASMTSDAKALHYLTAPNMVLCDAASKAPGLQNSGPMLLFDPNDHRCCQHNVSHGWPYYAEHLWMATPGNGLGVAMYAPSEVNFLVGDGTPVRIVEDTQYPFGEQVTFRFTSEKPLSFPLTLRLPSWTTPKIELNGKVVKLPKKGSWAVISRTWKTGDVLVLHMPMKTSVATYPAHGGAVSVQRGPLTYSLKIAEKYVRKGGTDAWPAYEAHPESAWNYAIDPASIKVAKPKSIPAQPWDARQVPVSLTAKGRRLPAWQLDRFGLVSPLQKSPAATNEPLEDITLIPMGAARLRISVFPTFATRDGNEWVGPQMPKPSWPASSSHLSSVDTLTALSDDMKPVSSHDLQIPRFTWWDHRGTTEWVQYDFAEPRSFSATAVYWFDDRHSNGKCRVPASWRLLYWDNDGWHELKGSYPTAQDKFNTVKFTNTTSTKWRIEAVLQSGFSAGILEWVLK